MVRKKFLAIFVYPAGILSSILFSDTRTKNGKFYEQLFYRGIYLTKFNLFNLAPH